MYTYTKKNQEHPKIQGATAICGDGTHTVHQKIRAINKIGKSSKNQPSKLQNKISLTIGTRSGRRVISKRSQSVRPSRRRGQGHTMGTAKLTNGRQYKNYRAVVGKLTNGRQPNRTQKNALMGVFLGALFGVSRETLPLHSLIHSASLIRSFRFTRSQTVHSGTIPLRLRSSLRSGLVRSFAILPEGKMLQTSLTACRLALLPNGR